MKFFTLNVAVIIYEWKEDDNTSLRKPSEHTTSNQCWNNVVTTLWHCNNIVSMLIWCCVSAGKLLTLLYVGDVLTLCKYLKILFIETWTPLYSSYINSFNQTLRDILHSPNGENIKDSFCRSIGSNLCDQEVIMMYVRSRNEK